MEDILHLSIEEQNHIFNVSLFEQIKRDSVRYAAESGEEINAYLMRDFDANPEGWDVCFEHSWDEVSAKAKEERRNIVERMLHSYNI